jgi:hypothetical protein
VDTAVRVKPGQYNCGVTTAKCCGTNLKYEKWQSVRVSVPLVHYSRHAPQGTESYFVSKILIELPVDERSY